MPLNLSSILSWLLRHLGVYRVYERYLRGQISAGPMPSHIGVILDGNRRWAAGRGLPTYMGYRFGADVAEDLLEWCRELGIRIVTLYILSTENLSRRGEELSEIFRLLAERLERLSRDPRLEKYRVRVRALGRLHLLPEHIRRLLEDLEESTRHHDGFYLNVALAYGGRREILDAVKKVVDDYSQGKIKVEELDEEGFSRYLYTGHLPKPDPDLIIRTSGEERLSNFLLWQSAYSELVFLDVAWPEFRKIDLMRAIRIYQRRQRRFGL
jgi:tritrans,polycis-undecaprenyl-diphosphate synthase [geranylgeranyl-diphosphate specific]